MLRLLTEIIAWSQPLLSQKMPSELNRSDRGASSLREGIAQARNPAEQNTDADQGPHGPDRAERPGHEDHDAEHDGDNRVEEEPARPGKAAQPRVDDRLEYSLEKEIEGKHERQREQTAARV